MAVIWIFLAVTILAGIGALAYYTDSIGYATETIEAGKTVFMKLTKTDPLGNTVTFNIAERPETIPSTDESFNPNVENSTEVMNLLWASNSLGGETGEFQNIVKKIYRDYGGMMAEGMLFKLEDELGDVLWYWLFVCDILKLNPEKIMESNMIKLKKRYGIEQ